MKMLISLTTAALLFVGTCEETGPTFSVGDAFTLNLNTDYQAIDAKLQVRFTEVSEDSRCPRGTNCVWEGQAKVNLLVNGDPVTLILQEGEPALAEHVHAGHRFIAQGLTPYPVADTEFDASTYALKLLVQKLP